MIHLNEIKALTMYEIHESYTLPITHELLFTYQHDMYQTIVRQDDTYYIINGPTPHKKWALNSFVRLCRLTPERLGRAFSAATQTYPVDSSHVILERKTLAFPHLIRTKVEVCGPNKKKIPMNPSGISSS